MSKTFGDKISDNCVKPCYKYTMIVLGPLMVLTLYILVGIHVYAYFGYIIGLLPRRLGIW